MGDNPVGKKVNNGTLTWLNTFLRRSKYPGCLKVNTFLLLALGFYVNPKFSPLLHSMLSKIRGLLLL